MEKVLFESSVIEYLKLPSIPKKEWDGESSFKDGVAVVQLLQGRTGYAVATFNAEKDSEPRIKKTFSIEPFSDILKIFVVPSYMDTDEKSIIRFDVDNDSKEAAMRLAQEANELENEGTESEKMKEMKQLPEWVFDNIHNLEEAQAYIKRYNSQNKIKGKLPSNEDTVKCRLLAIYNEINNK